MAITARTPQKCVDEFRDQVAPIVSTVFGSPYFGKLDIKGKDGTSRVGFLQGKELVPISIDTRCGPLGLFLSQLVKAERVKGGKGDEKYRLSTLKYQYILAEGSDPNAAPVMRWEYDRVPAAGKLHCRHHLHQGHTIKLGSADFDLDKAHVPTGWVLLEEVFRFLIVELEMKPADDDWDDQLRHSTRKFHDSFTVEEST